MYHSFIKRVSSMFKKPTNIEPKYQRVQIQWDELTQAQACEVLFELIAQGRGIDIVRLRTKLPFLNYEVKK
mgnify:CR=1 FL=1